MSVFPLMYLFALDEISSMPLALKGSYQALEKALYRQSFRRCQPGPKEAGLDRANRHREDSSPATQHVQNHIEDAALVSLYEEGKGIIRAIICTLYRYTNRATL
jgi:hypothetical protein